MTNRGPARLRRHATWLVAVLALATASCSGPDDPVLLGPPVSAPASTSGSATSSVGPSTAAAIDVATTAPSASAPVSAATPRETASPTSVVPPPSDGEPALSPGPPVDEGLAARLHTVPGGTYRAASASTVPWARLGLPAGVEVYAADVTFPAQSGTPVNGTAILVQGARPEALFEDYVDLLFGAWIPLTGDAPSSGDEGPAGTDEARAVWQAFDDTLVVSATVPDVDAGQWVWSHGGLTWIVIGPAAMEEYVTALTAAQQDAVPTGPLDYRVLIGGLADRRPEVPGYTYGAFPRTEALTQMAKAWSGDCAEEFYISYVVNDDDPTPDRMQTGDLGLVMASIGGVCRDEGFIDNLATAVDALPGIHDATIGGATVRQNAENIVYVDDDVIVHLSSTDPTAFTEMAPFITAFLAAQSAD